MGSKFLVGPHGRIVLISPTTSFGLAWLMDQSLMWSLLAVASYLLFACCNILDSHFTWTFKNPASQNFACGLYYFPLALLIFAVAGFHFPTLSVLPWIVAAGAAQGLYLIPYFAAMKKSDSSIVTSLFTLGRASGPLLAYFLIDEQLSPVGYVGFAIVVLGALFHSFKPSSKRFDLRLLFLMSLSGFMVAVLTVTSKTIFLSDGIVRGLSEILFMSACFSTSVSLVPSMRRALRADLPTFRHVWKLFSLTTTISLLALAFFYSSVSLTKTSYVLLVAQFQPFFVLALMIVARHLPWLKTKESFTGAAVGQKLVGFLIMLTGMSIVLLG